MTGFTGYVAESRAKGTTWTMIADGATFEAVRSKRAIGDITPVTSAMLWDHVAMAMANKPYKALGMDLSAAARRDRNQAVENAMRFDHMKDSMTADGRSLGREARMQMQANAIRQHIPKHIAALDAAITQGLKLGTAMTAQEKHLRQTRVEAEDARRILVAAQRRSGASPEPQ